MHCHSQLLLEQKAGGVPLLNYVPISFEKNSFSNYLPIYFIDTMYQLVCLIYVVHIENRLSPFDNTVPEYYWPKVCGCVGVGGGGIYRYK